MNINLKPLYLLILCAPFAIALQNSIMIGILLWIFCTEIPISRLKVQIFYKENVSFFLLFFVSFAFVGFAYLSSIINIESEDISASRHFLGYLAWVFLPLLILYKYQSSLMISHWKKLANFTSWTVLFWGIVCFSQWFWGWRIVGISLISDLEAFRARGFYSHPLTLAYSCLLIWPLAITWLLRDISNIYAWFMFLGLCSCLYFSGSRMVQFISFLSFLFSIYRIKNRALNMYYIFALYVA